MTSKGRPNNARSWRAARRPSDARAPRRDGGGNARAARDRSHRIPRAGPRRGRAVRRRRDRRRAVPRAGPVARRMVTGDRRSWNVPRRTMSPRGMNAPSWSELSAARAAGGRRPPAHDLQPVPPTDPSRETRHADRDPDAVHRGRHDRGQHRPLGGEAGRCDPQGRGAARDRDRQGAGGRPRPRRRRARDDPRAGRRTARQGGRRHRAHRGRGRGVRRAACGGFRDARVEGSCTASRGRRRRGGRGARGEPHRGEPAGAQGRGDGADRSRGDPRQRPQRAPS